MIRRGGHRRGCRDPDHLAIEANPSAGTLSGTTTVNTAANGVAAFSDLSIDAAGVGYTLTATSPGLTPATSAAFTVLPYPVLGDAGRYSVLGGAGVVSTLASTISGDVGVAPGNVVTGFPPGTVAGDIHLGDADAVSALADFAKRTRNSVVLPPNAVPAGDLGGTTLAPGIYHSTAALAVTGTLTLNAGGNPDADFIIQIDAALNTTANSSVVLVNGAQAGNVFWVVDGAATMGAGSLFKGAIMAQGAITLGLDTELIGRAFSAAAVTLASNTIRFTVALPPTLTIVGDDPVVTKDTTPVITGTSSAPNGTIVKVTVNGQAMTTTVQNGGTWTLTAEALLAGSYTVVAQVRDFSGNAAKTSQTRTVEVNPDPLLLGSAASFSVLSGTAVVNGGPTHLSGDLGVSPGSVVTGFPDGTLDGIIHAGNSTAADAQADLLTAIEDAEERIPHTEIAGDLGGRTFHVGVHRSAAALGLTGTVTLDGEDDPNAVFIFQVGAAFTAAANCEVNLINGAQARNVFWVVHDAADTGASCTFNGIILARGAITLGAGTNLVGQALSRAGVTLASNRVDSSAAGAAAARSADSARPSGSEPASAPNPTGSPSPVTSPSPSGDAGGELDSSITPRPTSRRGVPAIEARMTLIRQQLEGDQLGDRSH